MDKVLKWVLIGCLVIPVIIVMIAVLAGIVLVAINPAEKLEMARRVTIENNMAVVDVGIAVARVENPKKVLSCDDLTESLDLTPINANSCSLEMGDSEKSSMILIYSFNEATDCAIVSTTVPVVGKDKDKYLYYKFADAPSKGKIVALESPKMEQCE